MNDFLPSPESLTRPAPVDAPPVVHSADGLPLSLTTVQGLEAFLEQRMESLRAEQARNINQAIMTVIPDVLELHHAQTRQAALVHVPQAAQGQMQQRDPIAAILAGGFVLLGLAAMGGMGWSMVQSPNASTQKVNQELLQQVQQQNQQLIQSNEQIQQSQQRCPRVAIAATCNIGE
jgi:hypothetical protein